MDDRPTDQLAVEASGLGRRFGRFWAAAHIDLAVPYGCSVWLRGSNGAGKTTLLRMLATLSTPSRGTLRVDGLDSVGQRDAVRRRVALVSHALYLYPGLTARETLALWQRLGGQPVAAPEVDRALAEVGLRDAAEGRVGTFSAGMRKRLALARARLESPRLLLLDEPFSSLDEEGCQLVERWVGAFAQEGGTVILASHNAERSARLCDLHIELARGQIVSSRSAR